LSALETIALEATSSSLTLRPVAKWRGIRVLAWKNDVLYGCRGYKPLRLPVPPGEISAAALQWQPVADFHPTGWRNLTSRLPLAARLMRDGFHALAIPELRRSRDGGSNPAKAGDPTLIAAVPGAIVTKSSGSQEFRVTHKISRGTRPLHFACLPDGSIYWGEYFDNRDRNEVSIYASADLGESWHVAYTFPAGAIRHVHNVVYDPWSDCLWILTGDEDSECKVLRSSRDLRSVEVVLSGSQQTRAVAAIPMPDALYLSTDTPFEANHVLRLDRNGIISPQASLSGSSIFGCRVGESLFFSTMVEPSATNPTREVHLVGSYDQKNWQVLARWRKDVWPMHFFQYGNAILPDGENATNYLATTTIAVEHDDMVTTLWEVTATKPNVLSPGRMP